MDWNAAIERNGQALKRILAMLVAMARQSAIGSRQSEEAADFPTDCRLPTGDCRFLPRHLHRAILRLLRPAEAAARRLVIVAARNLAATPQARKEETVSPLRPQTVRPKSGSIFVGNGRGTGIVLPAGVRPGAILPGLATSRPAPRSIALPLLDPLRGLPHHRRPTGCVPRISAPGISNPYRSPDRRPISPYDQVDATRLALRLQAVGRALDDLPGHARRFARWRMGAGAASRNKSPDVGLFRRVSPLRPGRPPGSCRRPTHEVHEVLADLHHFAFSALERRDTS